MFGKLLHHREASNFHTASISYTNRSVNVHILAYDVKTLLPPYQSDTRT